MGFPQVQESSPAGSGLPLLAARGYARAKQAFGMGATYAGSALQQQANEAMGTSTGANVSKGAGFAGGGGGGGFSKGSGGGFGFANTSATIPNVDPRFAAIDAGQFWAAINQSVSASGTEDDAPAQVPMKRGSVFSPYNNGDFRTQGDYNRISGDHGLKNQAADWKVAFGSHHSNQLPAMGRDHSTGGWVADNIGGWGGAPRGGSPYVGDQSPGVYKPFNPATDSDPPGYVVPSAFSSKSKFGKFARSAWGRK